MGAPPTEMGAKQRAFAKRKGKTLRTAQLARANNTLEWQAFCAELESEGNEDARPTKPDFADMDESQLSNPQIVVKWTWELLESTRHKWEKETDGVLMKGCGDSYIKAQDAYFKAKRELDLWMLSEREMIPRAEYDRLIPFVDQFISLIRSCPSEIALNANPASPATARAAYQSWLDNRLGPAARALAEQLP